MGKDNKRKTTEQYKSEVYNLVENKISVLGEYINCKTHVKMKCNECGNIFDMSPDHFLRGYRCPKCSYKKLGISRRRTTSEISEKLSSLGYELLESYKVSNTPLKIKHLKCGTIFSTPPRSIIYNYGGCPHCRMSKGENKIKEWLIANNIQFEAQARFNDCKYIRTLPFDFKILINNTTILIEYNGIQHYQPNHFTRDLAYFDIIKKRDKIKYDYCLENNIKLITIDYTNFDNIEKILKEQIFNDYNSTLK